ncbi:hypothetical protein QJS04_geneDACA014739 [Acorus gramineus]|uniref:FAR1 domain-containing protein n=1 Tax=Acorus gramineus TaxID=55184 RepID=A0AAV9BPC8_ACOGR|nr:hypothetical protein QJS04_geneDACA014739 [Acorus gramineus]
MKITPTGFPIAMDGSMVLVFEKVGWFNRSKGIVSRCRFCCSKEGQRGLDKRQEKIQNPRPQTRTGCKAEMIISYRPSGTYHVIKFEVSHNHETVASPFRHILQSQRKIGKVEAAQVDIAEGSGIAPKSVVEMMGQQAKKMFTKKRSKNSQNPPQTISIPATLPEKLSIWTRLSHIIDTNN